MSAPKFTLSLSKAVATTVVGVSILLPTAQIGLANTSKIETTTAHEKSFRPPSNPRRVRGYRTTTGTRQGSCVGDANTAFTVLGPSDTVGLTASTRPAFVWNLPPSSEAYPVQFRLLAPNADGIPTPIHTAELTYKAGITKYSLPVEVTGLSPDVEYRWQVIVVCDENYLSRSLNQELAFEVVTPDAALQQSLQSATTDMQRATLYGEAGYWYDAIAQVAGSTEPEAQNMLQTLIEDLAEVESENTDLSEDLLEIANNLL